MKVLIFGTFDWLHPGHEFVLMEARKRACPAKPRAKSRGRSRGNLTVVIARDATVEHLKGHRPRQNEQERRAAIQKVVPSATVVLGDEEDFLRPVRDADPDLILLGYDQRLPPGIMMEDLPCAVERLPALQSEQYKSSKHR